MSTDLSSGLHRGSTPADVAAPSTADEPAAPVGPAELTEPGSADDPDQARVTVLSDEHVAEAVAGRREAVERLLGAVRPFVVRYCRARFGREDRASVSADDIAQEVCMAVLNALPSYRAQGKPFLAFVYGIAAHKVADAHRRAARNRSVAVPEPPDGPDLAPGPELRAVSDDLSRELARLLDVLPEKQREIVLLRVVVGMSAEETAAAVGSTAGAVRVAQHRALARLREALAR